MLRKITEKRTYFSRPKQMIGGEIPAEPVKSTVAIIRKNDQYGQPFCSGTLISGTMVLAPAHCFEEDDPTNIKVVAGEMNIVWGTKGVTRGIKSLKIHPDYTYIMDKRNGNKRVQIIDGDLALVELDQPLDLENNDNIVKAELPTLSMKLTNKLIQIGGWGRTKASPDFLSINITVKPNKECSETFDHGTYFPDR
jgi:secreted trypsin-like serine protease